MGLDLYIPESLRHAFLFKLAVASFLGAVIGLERDMHGRAAGLRTNLLVSLGSAVFMLLSEYIPLSYAKEFSDTAMRGDPSRIAAQIITGIGFLGAGAIIKSGLTIRGLTTAACLWISAGIGMTIGAGYYSLGIATTIISLFSLVFLNKLESFYLKDSYRIIEIKTSNETDISGIIKLISTDKLKVTYVDKDRNYIENTMKLTLTLKLTHKGITDKLSHDIMTKLEQSGITLYNIRWYHQ